MSRHSQYRVVCFLPAILLQLSFVTAALALDHQTTKERLADIEKMSSLERTRLELSIERFRSMSEQERQHFRDLHAELTKDRVANGGAMLQTLQSYNLWLQTLSPAQQNELRNQKEVSRKMFLVQKFKAEQEQQLKQELEHSRENRDTTATVETKQPQRPKNDPMSETDLQAVMKVVIANLPPKLNQADFEPVRLSQYFPIIQASLEASAQSNVPLHEWPDKDLLYKLKKAVSPRIVRVVELYEVWDEKSERETMARLILAGIDLQIKQSVIVSKKERDRLYESLSKQEQAEVKKLKDRQQSIWLTKKYHEIKNDDSFERATYYRQELVNLAKQLDVTLPQTGPRLPKPRSTSKK